MKIYSWRRVYIIAKENVQNYLIKDFMAVIPLEMKTQEIKKNFVISYQVYEL